VTHGAHQENARTGTGSGLFAADSLTIYAESHAVCCRLRALNMFKTPPARCLFHHMLAAIADAKDDLFAIRCLIVFVFCQPNRISAVFLVNQNNCHLV
jgi:hypothetical protein